MADVKADGFEESVVKSNVEAPTTLGDKGSEKLVVKSNVEAPTTFVAETTTPKKSLPTEHEDLYKTPVTKVDPLFPPHYKDIVIHLLSILGGGYLFRKFKNGYQSCYASGLVLILISMFPDQTIGEIVEKIKPIISFRRFEYPYLSRIIAQNQADVTSAVISDIRQLDPFLEENLVFVGFVSHNSEYINGRILHYFIFKKVGGKYFIFSSYGSEHVAIKQYVSEVELVEINEGLGCLATLDKNQEDKDKIDSLFRKYFLGSSYHLVQNRTREDFEERHGHYPRANERHLLTKNKEDDILKEISYYQREPIYLKVFPYTKMALAYELALLQLKEDPSEEKRQECKEMIVTLEAKMLESPNLIPVPVIDPELGFDITEADIQEIIRKEPESPIALRVQRRNELLRSEGAEKNKGGKKTKRGIGKRKTRKVC